MQVLHREPRDAPDPARAYHRTGEPELVALYVVAAPGKPPRVALHDGVHTCSVAWFMGCISHFQVLPPSQA